MKAAILRRFAMFLGSISLVLGSSQCAIVPGADEGMMPRGQRAPQDTGYVRPRLVDRALPAAPVAGGAKKDITYTQVPVNGPYVALTFDDGPHGVLTPKLLGILRQYHAKATFFVLGQNVVTHPQILREMVAEGHEVANHSWSHPILAKLPLATVASQLERTNQAIANATGHRPTLMRPPYGAFTHAQREWCMKTYGMPTILWSVDPLDWKRPGSAVVASRIISGARPGGILLMHDIHPGSVEAVPQILSELTRRGYRFVTVSELMSMRAKPVAKQP